MCWLNTAGMITTLEESMASGDGGKGLHLVIQLDLRESRSEIHFGAVTGVGQLSEDMHLVCQRLSIKNRTGIQTAKIQSEPV